MRNRYLYLIAPLLLLAISGCKKEENKCSTNGYGSWYGYDVCYRVVANNYNTGVLPSGDTVEALRIEITGETRAPYSRFDLSTQSYVFPPAPISGFKVNEEYYNTYAAPFVQDAVQLKDGTFKFTKFDRAARKLSGYFSYTYVQNLTQGNVDRVITVTFEDVAF